MTRAIRTIDAHAGGQPLRLIVDGVPRPPGVTLDRKRAWFQRRADDVRRGLVLEPRGHLDMTAAVLTEPVSPESHAGIVFMDAGGYPPMSAHGIIAAVTIAVERELFFSRDAQDDVVRLALDTPAGTVHARARLATHGGARRVESVAFTSVPAFVHAAARPVALGTRRLRVDIAFGGAFFAIADTEAIGLPLDAARLPDLRRFGDDIRGAVAAQDVRHPLDPALGGLAGVVFTGPAASPDAHLRNVTVGPGGADRSPGAGTAAVMAVLDAMGLLAGGQEFVSEGLFGSLLRGRVARRTIVGEVPGIAAEIEGSAWITGEHVFLFEEGDPFREGIGV